MILAAAIGAVAMLGAGCARPYQQPKFDMIPANHTAFVIPLNEKTSEQAQWQSEAFLDKHQVSSKRITIPQDWIQTGRWMDDGYYQDTVQVIHVPLTPVTREWTSDATGTSGNDQGIRAHTADGVGFTAHMNISAQIKEQNASTFIHWFGAGTQDKDTNAWTSTLETVMDSNIRPKVAALFVAECGKYTLEELMKNEGVIMASVEKDTSTYCSSHGITLTLLGLQGQIKLDNTTVQAALDASVSARVSDISQQSINKQVLEKATADAQAAKIMASTNNSQFTSYNIQLRKLEIEKLHAENEKEFVAKWNGTMPTTVAGNQNLLSLGSNK